MNRKERRALKKKIRTSQGEQINAGFVNYLKQLFDGGSTEELNRGDKVKLNVKKITSSPDWSRMQPRYRKFVLDHSDDVFTVEYDPRFNTPPILIVCLAEDNSEIKWLWRKGDLLKVEEASNESH